MRGKRKLADIMSLPGYSPRQPVIFTKVKDEKNYLLSDIILNFVEEAKKRKIKS